MTAIQSIQACSHGQDQLKFKPSIRIVKKGDLRDLERGMVVVPDELV